MLITRLNIILLFAMCLSCTRTLKIRHNLTYLRHSLKKDSTSNFIIYYPKGGFIDSNSVYLRRSIETYRADILKMMREKDYSPKIEAFFFSTKNEMNSNLKTLAEGISFPKDNTAAFIFSRNFSGYTRHELSHIISINLWGKSALWIEEGFATLTDESFQKVDFHKQTNNILNTKDYIPIETLFDNFKQYNGNWYRYVETASLLKFIIEKYDIEGLKKVWKSKTLFVDGKSANVLIKEWLAMLETHQLTFAY
jgi:hypothetical protein